MPSMDYAASYLTVPNQNYSPPKDKLFDFDSFDNSYLLSRHGSLSDRSFSSFYRPNSHENDVTEADLPATLQPMNDLSSMFPDIHTPTIESSSPCTAWPTTDTMAYGHTRDFERPYAAPTHAASSLSASSHGISPAGSDSTEADQFNSHVSGRPSPSASVQGSPFTHITAPLRPGRKHGRPRTRPGGSSKILQRVPHNQVERKYRERLNMELERLRRAVPTLPQSNIIGTAKPSKAMVLNAAIEYIKHIERERDVAINHMKMLGVTVPPPGPPKVSSCN